MLTDDKVEKIFQHQPPTEDMIPKFQQIRADANRLAKSILKHTPASADQTAAIRKVREAVMTANAAIALKGLV